MSFRRSTSRDMTSLSVWKNTVARVMSNVSMISISGASLKIGKNELSITLIVLSKSFHFLPFERRDIQMNNSHHASFRMLIWPNDAAQRLNKSSKRLTLTRYSQSASALLSKSGINKALWWVCGQTQLMPKTSSSGAYASVGQLRSQHLVSCPDFLV